MIANWMLLIAFVAFLVALIDRPPASAVRCIAIGLALFTLSFAIRWFG